MSEKGFKLHLSQQFKSGFFGFQPHFPFSHQRLSKDLRKAKRRDAEALKSFVSKRWKRSRRCGITTSRVFHLQTDQMCPTQCAQVQPPPIGECFSLLANKISFIGDLTCFLSYFLSFLIHILGEFCFWLLPLGSNIKMGLGKSNDVVGEKTSDKLQ